jgi:hypothetical protein
MPDAAGFGAAVGAAVGATVGFGASVALGASVGFAASVGFGAAVGAAGVGVAPQAANSIDNAAVMPNILCNFIISPCNQIAKLT